MNKVKRRSSKSRRSADEASRQGQVRLINAKVLIGTVVIVALGGTGAYFWHSYQAKRAAGALLERAEQLKAEEDYVGAAAHMFRYTRLQPDDTQALIRLAQVHDQDSKDSRRIARTVELYYQALAVAEGEKQTDIRRRLTVLLLKQQRFVEAEKQARRLVFEPDSTVRRRPNADFEDSKLLAQALLGRYFADRIAAKDMDSATKDLVSELRHALGLQLDPELVSGFARLLCSDDPRLSIRPPTLENTSTSGKENPEGKKVAPMSREARLAEANRLMDQLVQQRADSPEAWLTRARFLRRQGDHDGAEKDIQHALKIDESDAKARLAAATSARQKATDLMKEQGLTTVSEEVSTSSSAAANIRQLLETALNHYQFVLDNTSGNGDEERDAQDTENRQSAVLGVAEMSALLGNADHAIELLQQELKSSPANDFALRWNLANLLLAENRADSAQKEITTLAARLVALNTRSDRYRFISFQRSFNLMIAKCIVRLDEFDEGFVRLIEQRLDRKLKSGELARKKREIALRFLDRVITAEATSSHERHEQYQALIMAGELHQEAGYLDLAAEAYAKAAGIVTDDNARATAHARAAAAWENAGAIDHAIAECRRALGISRNASRSPQLQLQLTRNLLVKQQQYPVKERDWSAYRQAFDQLVAVVDDVGMDQSWQLDLLKADYELVRAAEAGQMETGVEKAVALAAAAENEHPDDPALMENLISFYQRLRKSDRASRALKRFQELTDDEMAARMAAVRLHIQQKDFDVARAMLKAAQEAASPSARPQIRKTEARIEFAAGNYDRASDILDDLSKQHPGDMSIAQMQMQLARQQDDSAGIRELEERLIRNTPKNNRWVLATKIQRLLEEATSADSGESARTSAPFREAMDVQRRLETQHPSWSVAQALRGQIEEMRGNLAQASRAYRRAIELGDRRIVVFERLITTLYRLGRFQDARGYLSRIESVVPSSNNLTTVAMSISERMGEEDQAIELARQAMERRPDDATARVWYGQMLLRHGEFDQAKSVLTKAVDMAPESVVTWNGLFEFHRTAGDKDEAQKVLARMADQLDLPEGRLQFVLGQAHESLGDYEEAEAAYRKAIDLSDDSRAVRMQLLSLYEKRAQQGDVASGQKSIEELRRIVARDPDNWQAKRRLARMLVRVGGQSEWQEAEKLFDNMPDSDGSAVNRRTKAFLLMQRGGKENLKEARTIVEDLLESPEFELNDRRLLGNILERQNELKEARRQYRLLAASKPARREYLEVYIDFLIRQEEPQEAREWLDTFKKTGDQQFDFPALRLQARILDLEGKASKISGIIDPPVNEYVETLSAEQTSRKASLVAAVANLYSQFQLYAAEEKWNRRLVELDPNQFRRLAICLARQGKMQEAIDLCTDAAKNKDVTAAFSAVAAVLVAGKPSETDFERAEGILKAAEERYSNNPNVLFALTNVRIVQNRMDEAIRLLKKVVKLQPKNAIALNNLASIMAEQPEMRRQAIEYIDRAIQITGPRAQYYDTKGSILLHENKLDEALELLKFAVASNEDDPRYDFHLAATYFKQGKKEQAATHLREAIDGDLEDQVLIEADRRLLEEMKGLMQ